jgi:hypothetical protein
MQVLGIVYVFTGVLNTLYGYRFFKFIIGLYGFLAGAVVGAAIGSGVMGGETTGIVLGALILGCIGAALAVLFYYFGVLLVGAFLGLLIASALIQEPGTTVQVIFAVVGAILAVAIQKFIIVVATSFSGSYFTLAGIFVLLGGLEPNFVTDLLDRGFFNLPVDVHPILILILCLVLTVFGVLFQYQIIGRRKPVPKKATSPEAEPETEEG